MAITKTQKSKRFTKYTKSVLYFIRNRPYKYNIIHIKYITFIISTKIQKRLDKNQSMCYNVITLKQFDGGILKTFKIKDLKSLKKDLTNNKRYGIIGLQIERRNQCKLN